MEVIVKAIDEKEDFIAVEEIARKIWYEHYVPIIGAEQVEYMLNKMQNANVMISQYHHDGYKYYKALYNGVLAGYCAVKYEDENKSLFLSKLYVLKEFRGLGIAKIMMKTFLDEYNKIGIKNIHLNVNKNNINSINAYKKMGFKIFEEVIVDIGGGYVMDDYKMILEL